jgi:hypothetical protein
MASHAREGTIQIGRTRFWYASYAAKSHPDSLPGRAANAFWSLAIYKWPQGGHG